MDKRSSARVVKIAEMLMHTDTTEFMEFHGGNGTVIWFSDKLTVKELKSLAASVLAQARGKP